MLMSEGDNNTKYSGRIRFYVFILPYLIMLSVFDVFI